MPLRMRFILTLMTLATAMALAIPVAHGELTPWLDVEIGHADRYVEGRYNEVRIALRWNDEPEGDEPIPAPRNGFVRFQYSQDATHEVVIGRSILIEPGRTTRTVVYARPFRSFDDAEVEVSDDRGRVIARWSPTGATGRPPGVATAGLVTSIDRGSMVLAVGRQSLSGAGAPWSSEPSWTALTMSSVRVGAIEVPEFPRAWPGLDAIGTLVLGDFGTESLDARQLVTLDQWLREGGRLVVIAAADRRLFDEVVAPLVPGLEALEFQPVEPQGTLQAVFDRLVQERSLLAPRASTAPSREIDGQVDPAEPPQSVPRAESGRRYARRFRISEAQVAAGWSVRSAEHWLPAAADVPRLRHWAEETARQVPSAPDDAREGDVVTGPIGAGSVTVLGFDPATLAASGDSAAVSLAWWQALRHVPELAGAILADETRDADVAWAGDGRTLVERMASNLRLDLVSATFDPNVSALGAFIVALIALAVLIGPFDYLVLRRLDRLPYSWLTSVGWILLACVGIWAAQSRWLGQPGRVVRARFIDLMEDGRAWCSGVTAVGSPRNAAFAVVPTGADRFLAPLDHLPEWWWGGDDRMTMQVTAVSQSQEGAAVDSIRVPINSVRWVEDRGHVAPVDVSASVEALTANRVSITINHPPGLRPVEAAILFADGAIAGGPIGEGDPGHPVELPRRVIGPAPTIRRGPMSYEEYNDHHTRWQSRSEALRYFDFGRHAEIGAAYANLEPDRAVVVVRFDGGSPDVTVHGAAVDRMITYVRTTAPVVDRRGAAAEPAPVSDPSEPDHSPDAAEEIPDDPT